MKQWYKFTWADGTVTYAGRYNKIEKDVMERKHGKLISKVPV